MLTIPAGTTLSNNGRIRDLGTVVNHGSIVNDGALIVGSGGTISGVGSFSGNKGTQDAPAAPVAESVGEGSVTLAPGRHDGARGDRVCLCRGRRHAQQLANGNHIHGA